MKKDKKKEKKKNSALCRIGRIIMILFLIGLAILIAAAIINLCVVSSAKKKILTEEEAVKEGGFDCILVLGCYVRNSGKPSDMLEDRLLTGISAYRAGAAPKLLMSGDHGRTEYDEVNTMKAFAMAEGIASSDIFIDHAGFSTYESVYRAKEIFGCKKILIVTNRYHLYRALKTAEMLGLEAYGISSDIRNYRGEVSREAREFLARVKDFTFSVIKPKPTYLGKVIPISGDGNLTNDGNTVIPSEKAE